MLSLIVLHMTLLFTYFCPLGCFGGGVLLVMFAIPAVSTHEFHSLYSQGHEECLY